MGWDITCWNFKFECLGEILIYIQGNLVYEMFLCNWNDAQKDISSIITS
jgi:hypothetical protein